jgi:hypothetical protein
MSQRHSRSTEGCKIYIPVFKHKRDDMSFLISGPKCWNQLPNNVTIIYNFAMFLTAVVSYIKSKLLTN